LIGDTSARPTADAIDPGAMGDVCLFAHFDPGDIVDEWVFHYLARLRELSFSIVFISTSPIPDDHLARLRMLCRDVIVRANCGLDFASWAAGFRKHEKFMSGRLLLANSSVYGPVHDLAPALNALTSKPADFYGFVESIDVSPHLQSWFLLFEPHVARGALLKDILGQPFAQMTKDQIIANGEVALSTRLTAGGLRYRALYRPSQAGWAERTFGSNPMHLFWREMITIEGIPFLKVALLRDNPLGLKDSADAGKVIEARDPALWNLIVAHQARIARPHPERPPGLWQRVIWSPRLLYHRLMRKGYQLHRSHRRADEAYNFMLLAMLHVVRAAARPFRRLWLP
jgi:lipopolysaccharide biosynthesis protein